MAQAAVDVPRRILGYEVVGCLGDGAGSMIYAVTDPATRHLYALKRVTCRTARDRRYVTQLQSEYEIGRRVDHPGLRRVIALTIQRTLLRRVAGGVLVLELFDGEPLAAMFGPSLPKLLSIFMRVGEALRHLHAAGYVHCDLKPGNILVNSGGEAKVIDLGQACPIGTVKSRIQGTPDYIAPEQVRCEPVTARTDVFSFGATLYWALCRRPVPTLMTVSRADNSFLVDGFVASPSDIDPSIPDSLSRLTMECIRTNPAKRPVAIADVVSRLELIAHSLAWRGAAAVQHHLKGVPAGRTPTAAAYQVAAAGTPSAAAAAPSVRKIVAVAAPAAAAR